MAFLETPRFPLSVANGAGGGPMFETDIVSVRSGYEYRNANWALPLRRFNAALGVKTIEQAQDLRDYFLITKGKHKGFRFKDLSDWKSCDVEDTIANTDQTIGTGDGTNRVFQLVKTYVVGAESLTYTIKKPVTSTTVIAVNGVANTQWTVDTTTGIVTFNIGHAPAAAATVTAGYEYDVPVRFDTDFLDMKLLLINLVQLDVPLVEIRL